MSATEPHLSLAEAPAGVSSARQTISQEPSFTRKRKVHDSDSQTVQECVLHHGREDTDTNNEKNPAVLFKGGQRRPLPAPIPSEYQLQFTWKSGGLTEAPLVAAEKLISDGESKKKGETMGVRQRGKERGGGGGGGKENAGGKPKEREKGENGRGKVEIKVQNTGSRNAPPQNMKKPRFNGTSLPRGGGAVQQRSPSKSPQRELRRKPRGNRRHSRGSYKKNRKTATGLTEYRAQFKAWPIPSEPVSHGKKTKKIRNSKKRSDITDPRLATPPPLPDSLPGALKSGLWGTEYSTRFKSPLYFQYVRGAWMESPQPSPIPDVHCLESDPNQPESDHQGGKKEQGEEDEQPITPQESLLAQLSEIRRKATEYRQRSEMCHIIPANPRGTSERQHEPETEVALKDAQLNSLSASPSISRSSSSSSLNNDGSPDQNSPSHDKSSHLHTSQDHTLTNGGEVGEGGEGSEEGSDTESSSEDDVEKDSHCDNDISHKHRSQNNQICESREQGEKMNGYTGGWKIRTVSPSPPPTAPDSNGRVPTPILRETSEQMRHHLDRTTPSSGSVLTSPPLPAFHKSSHVSTSSRTAGNVGRTGKQSKVGVHGGMSTSHLSKGKKQGEKTVASKQWNSGLYLSRGSPKLKHDRSLVSSVNGDPRSSSSRHTRPKSTTSHLPKVHPPLESHPTPHPLGTTHHTLATTHPAHSLSSVSSLLSSVSNSSSPGAVRRLDYNANTLAKAAVNPLQPPQSRPSKPHSHTCTNAQCDICGAWLRKSQTLSIQHLNVNSHASTSTKGPHFSHAPQSTAHSHQHKGTLTKSQTTTTRRSNSNIRSISQSNVVTVQDSPTEIARPTLREPDELSISSLSLSSCSVASDLLKKARERRERFWTQPNSM